MQDEWRANNSVTVSLGLRYELRPPFEDREENISNFLRDTPNGDVVVPSRASIDLTAPGFAGSIGTSRILAADDIGYPKTLRFTDKDNVEPRLGIAWRPGRDNRTVIRGGYGLYHARILGQVFNSLTGIHTSDNVTFFNAFDPAARTYSIVWPKTFAGDPSRGVTRVGTQNFSTANDPRYKDPMTQQWSATFERELPLRQAFRVTYSGFRSTDLTMAPDLNQIAPNTVGFANLPAEARPFPNWNRVNTRDNGGYQNYHDFVAQFRGELTRWGVSHTTTYKWAHSIDNIEDRGAGQSDFQTEINGRTDNRFDPDYLRGRTTNIPAHRFVSSLIWRIPVGRGRAFGSDDAGRARRRRRRVDGVDVDPAAVRPVPHGVLQQPLRVRHELLRQREGGRGAGTGSGQRSEDARPVVQHRRVLDRGVPGRAGPVDLRGPVRQRREGLDRRPRRLERRPRGVQGFPVDARARPSGSTCS